LKIQTNSLLLNFPIHLKLKVMINKNKFKKGFSIGEVIISAFVLSVGLVAVIGLIASSIRSSASTRDQIIATELAQEGIELVRNVRDNNQAKIIKETAGGGSQSTDVFEDFPPGNSGHTNCEIDKDFMYSADQIECTNSNNYVLTLDSSGFYVHGAMLNTKFSRRIEVEKFNGDKGRKVTSIVTWNNSAPPESNLDTECNIATKCVWVETILTDRTI
jgi:Tfp pilus assembly protein PilV